MLSQVFLPITTAFTDPSGAFDVTRAKYAISCGRRHGRRPPCPMPFVTVAATMIVSRDMMEDAGWRMEGECVRMLGVDGLNSDRFARPGKRLQN